MIDNKKLILVTNDDGIHAKGLDALISVAKHFGKVVVVAPDEGQSGMSHAITIKVPIRLSKLGSDNDFEMYSCSGTPVDCIKLGLNQILQRKPDLVVSGINHGSNASASIVYSGTMAAAIEGCIYGVPSIGFSLLDFDSKADFSKSIKYVSQILKHTLEFGLPDWTCLNVNIPDGKESEIKGVKICRQTMGLWREEFEKRVDPNNREYYWLTGEFHNLEPEAEDTDEWALKNHFVSIVPVHIDMTGYHIFEHLKKWNFKDLE